MRLNSLSRRAEQGQSLVEVALSLVLLVVILGAGLSISVDSRDAWCQIYQDTNAVHNLREGLRALSTELASSASDQVTITPRTDHDTLDFRLPVSISGEAITWGADGTPAYTVRIAVVGGHLVRQVLDAKGTPVGRSRRLASNVDARFDGAKGFAVARDGTLCTITVRVRARQAGRTWRKQVTTAVLLRNE